MDNPLQAKATNWSITINNPTKNDEEYLALARQKGWKVEGQLEKGDNGTPHYQLLVTCKGQQRFTAMKKAFPRAHIEIAKDVAALRAYVNKEETRIAELPTSQEQYPSLQTMWDKFYDWLELDNNYKQFCSVEGDARLRYFDMFIEEIIADGYVVETMAVNPQIRSCIQKFGRAIAIRSNIRRQTQDRQTEQNNISPSSIPNEDAPEEE